MEKITENNYQATNWKIIRLSAPWKPSNYRVPLPNFLSFLFYSHLISAVKIELSQSITPHLTLDFLPFYKRILPPFFCETLSYIRWRYGGCLSFKRACGSGKFDGSLPRQTNRKDAISVYHRTVGEARIGPIDFFFRPPVPYSSSSLLCQWLGTYSTVLGLFSDRKSSVLVRKEAPVKEKKRESITNSLFSLVFLSRFTPIVCQQRKIGPKWGARASNLSLDGVS